MNHEQVEQHNNSRKSVWIAGAVLGLAVLILGMWRLSRPDTSPAPGADAAMDTPNLVELSEEAQRNANLQVAVVEERPLQETLTATGVVTSVPNRIAHIRPLAQGVAEEVLAQVGDRVQAGQPLMTYDNIELGILLGQYMSIQAEIRREQAQAEVARSYLSRAEALLAQEAIARKEYELRDAEYKQAVAVVQSKQAELAQVEEQIHRLGLTDEDLQRLDFHEEDGGHRTASHNTLRAPFAGIITKQEIAAGETIGPDTEVFTVADTSEVWVLADVYERDLGSVKAVGEALISVSSYPSEVFRGKITYVSDFLDPASRTAKVRCVVPNKDGRLKLDMFATVEIPKAETRKGVAVPEAALQQVNAETVVFVQNDTTHFEKRVIQTGERGGGWVEILRGVSRGDKVVGEGSFYLKSALMREQIGGED